VSYGRHCDRRPHFELTLGIGRLELATPLQARTIRLPRRVMILAILLGHFVGKGGLSARPRLSVYAGPEPPLNPALLDWLCRYS